MKRYLILTILFCIIINLNSLLKAEVLEYGFKEYGLFSGFFKSSLQEKKDLEEVPVFFHLGFDLRPIFKNKSSVLFEFLFEPFSSVITQPNYDLKTGCNFLLKCGFPFTVKLYPYLEAGVGFVYFTLQTREQATQFNFSQTVGVGISYFFKKNLNLHLSWRFSHLSNASIKKPNRGIESKGVILGLSVFY
ncbi:MAG: acyloxyacyl hydrolase [Candidatus Omnitrophica bacterium]|nr:acyloxyacyl hydrolase [Candidatus Omnitrophota bacterium]